MTMMRLQHTRPDGEVDTYHLKPGRKYHLGRGSMCEVRILDLKLSRKHCIIEHGPRGWQIEDLASTNGCRLDGQQIIGSAPLKVGLVITMGQSTLNVAALVETTDSTDDSSAAMVVPDANTVAAKRDTDSSIGRQFTPEPAQRTPLPDPWTEQAAGAPAKRDSQTAVARHLTPEPAQRTPLPDPWTAEDPGAAAKRAAPAAVARSSTPDPALRTPLPDAWSEPAKVTPAMRTPSPAPPQLDMPIESDQHARRPTVELDASDWQPEPAEAHVKTGPLAPMPPRPTSEVTPRPFAASPTAAQQPATPAPMAEPAPTIPNEPPRPRGPTPIKPVTIRVGADQVAAAIAANAAASGVGAISITPSGGVPVIPDDARTFSITVLGRRLGPLTRSEARDLKARELKGTLSEADLDPFPKL